MRQVFVLARNRYNSGSSLYFVRGGSEIISSDAVQNGKSPEIINLLLSVIYCNLSQAGMQRLFRGEKYLPGLYADGTFREDFLPWNKICARTSYNFAAGRDGLSRVENALWAVHSSTPKGHFWVWDKLIAQISHNFAAGRDGWVISSEKMPSGLYKTVRPEDIFLLGISQAPGPPEIYRLWMVSG